jgi:hypothetical protein
MKFVALSGDRGAWRRGGADSDFGARAEVRRC